MEEEEIRQLWADGKDWVIKRQNHQYSHPPDGKSGDWKPGLLPGAFQPDVDTLFDEYILKISQSLTNIFAQPDKPII